MIKSFFLNDRNIEKNSYMWNMMGSMLNAFQSVILLMIISRTVGQVASGVYSFAYANASLFLHMGNYGVRNYQVSDIKKKFSFKEYYFSRWISIAMMLLSAGVFIAYSAVTKDYSSEKTWIMIWAMLQKTVDALENVYHGQYHQNNRLDVAGRCMTIRMALLIVSFGVALIITRNLLVSLIASTVLTLLLFILFTYWTSHISRIHTSAEDETSADPDRLVWKKVRSLMWICLPLCAGSFLSFYIGNAPKYAIDALTTSAKYASDPDLADKLQGCFTYIHMPVFVVGLLNNFIFMPQMFKLSKMWQERDVRGFMKRTLRQVIILAGISLVCVGGAFLLGTPVLSILYNTDLAPYRLPLVILVLGGGFLGLTGFLWAVITIIRCQKYTMYGYAFVALLALFLANPIVERYEIMGASVLYLSLMVLLSIIFTGIFLIGVRCKAKKKDPIEEKNSGTAS